MGKKKSNASPQEWLLQIFNAKQVPAGGVVRRNKRHVEKQSSLQDLVSAARSFGFHLIETGDQYVVICNAGELRIHC